MIPVCLLGLAAVVGCLAIRAGGISAMQLSSRLAGVANVSVVNLDDNALAGELNQLDVMAEDAAFDRERLEPFDIGGFSSLDPDRYRLDSESAGNPRSFLRQFSARLFHRQCRHWLEGGAG